MIYKVLLLVIIFFTVITLGVSHYSQAQQQLQINFTRGDLLAENLLHLCSISTLIPVNASAAVKCQDDLYTFSKRFCNTYHDEFNVCRTGIIDSFLRGQGYTPSPVLESSVIPYPKNF